jgi:dual specificity tyrosine-phosphorylation-regulated kinase 2/3/4
MFSNKDYIYGSDLLQEKELQNRFTDEELVELKDRQEPVYYYYHKNKNFTSFKYQQKSTYTSDNRIELLVDDAIDYRYQVHSRLGKGAFGNVYRCSDHKRDLDVAVKVVRNERRFHKQAKIECDIHDLFNQPWDDGNREYVINMLKAFQFRDDIYMIFPNFGVDLYHYYKKNDIPIDDIKAFGNQIARGLSFIHSHSIIHMDIKPENIMIRGKHLKIIDLGSSIIMPEGKAIYKDYIQSRYYRCPEVVFNLEITPKIDIWSFGCILYELLTKKPLFPARSMNELALYHIHVLGYPLSTMTKIYENDSIFTKSKKLKSFRTKKGTFLYPNEFAWDSKIADYPVFKQLLTTNCLLWEPRLRASANDILEHPFFL